MKISYILPGIAGTLLCFITGCLSPTIEVSTAPDLAGYYGIRPSFEVDVAAVSEAEGNQVRTMAADQYFAQENPLRESLKTATLTFSRNTKDTATLNGNDPHWAEWDKKDADKLMLIVNLPAKKPDAKALPGASDSRILLMDAPQKSVLFRSTLRFQITANGITKLK